MTGGFQTDPEALQGNAPRYQRVSDQLQEIFDKLSNLLEAEGACWGNDDAGRAFAAKYVPGALDALQQMDSTNQGLRSMVDGICSWAKNYVNADDLAKADAAKLAGQ
jgi:uncharacterized protein YukE